MEVKEVSNPENNVTNRRSAPKLLYGPIKINFGAKKFSTFEKILRFLIFTTSYGNFSKWSKLKFFFPKCSQGFNELGGIGFRAVFVITKPPEALKFEISAILSIFMDFFYDTLRGLPKLMKFKFFLYQNVAKASN